MGELAYIKTVKIFEFGMIGADHAYMSAFVDGFDKDDKVIDQWK